jgi:hypothetical protein
VHQLVKNLQGDIDDPLPAGEMLFGTIRDLFGKWFR